jgi:hypothetical protein
LVDEARLANQNGFANLFVVAIHMQSRHTLLLAIFEPRTKQGPALIAVGLVVLLAAEYWSGIPVISGMALIALGATLAVASRFRCSPALPVVIVANLSVYSALYLLFVGAVFHFAFAKPDGSMTLLQGVDLGLSIVPMVAAVRMALSAIAGDEDVLAG